MNAPRQAIALFEIHRYYLGAIRYEERTPRAVFSSYPKGCDHPRCMEQATHWDLRAGYFGARCNHHADKGNSCCLEIRPASEKLSLEDAYRKNVVYREPRHVFSQ
jgi:hypothetical protein